MPRPVVILVLATVVGLFAAAGLAACGTVDSPPGGGGSTTTTAGGASTTVPGTTPSTAPPSTSTTTPDGSIPHPTGAGDVVIRVSTGGGFVPMEYNYTMIPEFTLYGDGRIIVTGPTTMQYPGNALPNLQTAVVPENVIQAMLSAAKEAGLFQNGVDYGQPGVTDVGTTTITVNSGGTTYTSQIYALGFEDGGNLTMQQQQARAAIATLQAKLIDPSTLGAGQLPWQSYDFTAIKVFSRAIDTTASTDSTDVRPNHLTWPLADLATAGSEAPNGQGLREVIVSGDDMKVLRPLLDQATQITVWESGAGRYNLWLRPLLPDEFTVS